MSATISLTEKAAYYLTLEENHGAHNYHPIPVVLSRGKAYLFGMLMISVITIF